MQKIANVLLIDDDEISNFLTSTVIRNTGRVENIQVCLDGNMALETLKRHLQQTGKCPELILLDLNMPEMNGFDFLEAYRSVYNCMHPSVIIILSTSDNIHDLEELKKYPEVEIYLNKPLNKDSFQYIIDKYFS